MHTHQLSAYANNGGIFGLHPVLLNEYCMQPFVSIERVKRKLCNDQTWEELEDQGSFRKMHQKAKHNTVQTESLSQPTISCLSTHSEYLWLPR